MKNLAVSAPFTVIIWMCPLLYGRNVTVKPLCLVHSSFSLPKDEKNPSEVMHGGTNILLCLETERAGWEGLGRRSHEGCCHWDTAWENSCSCVSHSQDSELISPGEGEQAVGVNISSSKM